MHLRIVLSVLLLMVTFSVPLIAQEVDCTVQVNYEAVPTTNKDLLRDFASDLRDYLDNYKWGQDNLGEKVKCTMNIFVQSVTGENKYLAQIFVGSQRKIFGTEKSTAVLRLFDESWEFTYLKSRPISHNMYSFNDLASVLDFYVYVILGYDYDSFEPLSGTPLFQKAADIANLGRSSGQKGWPPNTNSYSRCQFIDEILNPKFEPVRRASYIYNFTGLDSLAINPAHAYTNILHAIQDIGLAKKNVDPRNYVIKTFFDTKYLELADVFQGYSDPSVYFTLANVDQSHQKTYDEYRAKKK